MLVCELDIIEMKTSNLVKKVVSTHTYLMQEVLYIINNL